MVVIKRSNFVHGEELSPIFFKFKLYVLKSLELAHIYVFNSFGFMDFVLISSFVFVLDIYFSHKKSLLIN